MAETIDTLQHKMTAAIAALDFEEARRCRDMIGAMRGGATSDEAARADFSGLMRQQPGAMGLGSNQPQVTPPPGWKRPAKPDPLTSGGGARGGRGRGSR